MERGRVAPAFSENAAVVWRRGETDQVSDLVAKARAKAAEAFEVAGQYTARLRLDRPILG